MYTIVTAFFKLGRESWKGFERSVDYYLTRAKRVFSLDDYMVIYIPPELTEFVETYREKYLHKTKVIPLTVEELYFYKYKHQIQQVMQSPAFKEGLLIPDSPAAAHPLYDIVVWSKIPLVLKTIKENPFNSSHFVWLDFGIPYFILKDPMLNKPLLSDIADKIKLLCLTYPLQEDLDIQTFFKSDPIRFSGTMITGNMENFKLLSQYIEREVQFCLSQNLVGHEQALLCQIFLKHPELFELYYGWWGEAISNYDGITQNLVAIMHNAFTCKEAGRIDVFEEILGKIKNYTITMWRE